MMKRLIHIIVWFFRYKKGSIDGEVREILNLLFTFFNTNIRQINVIF